MKLPAEIQRSYALRGTLLAAVLNALGMLAEILLGRQVEGMPSWPPVLSGAAGILLVIALIVARRSVTPALAAAAFVVNTAFILIALWITSGSYAAAAGPWIPFQANKLGILAAAMLAPGLAAGVLTIAGFSGMVIGRYFTFAPDLRDRLPIGEPWTIGIYALFGCVALVYRLRRLAMEREMLRVHAEAMLIERLARTLLAVRDFANTPIQTIELTVEIVRRRHPDLAHLLGMMKRSVARLIDLNRMLSAYEPHLKWSPGDLSMDPTALIAPPVPRARPMRRCPIRRASRALVAATAGDHHLRRR